MNIIESLNTSLATVIAQSQSIFHKDDIKQAVDDRLQGVFEQGGEYSIPIVVEAVKNEGYIIIPSVFSGATLKQMSNEFHKIIASEEQFDSVDHNDGATCVRIRPFFKVKYLKQYPALFSFYNSKVLRNITSSFYAGFTSEVEHVSEVFVHETPETISPLSGKLHWDRLQTLKYWVYIDDLDDKSGPMLIEPRSIERNKETRAQLLEQKTTLVGGKDNVVDSPDRELVRLSAPAGSILIHDTDASHGASIVEPGNTRRIVRGHCRARI